MEGIKKFNHLIALGVSAIIMLSSFAYIFSMQNENTLYLKDLEGDSSYISDLVITGYLQDRNHGHKFEIIKGNLTSKFKYYGHSNDMNTPPILYGNGTADDEYSYWYGYSYEIASDAKTKVLYTENKIQRQYAKSQGTINLIEKTTTTYADKIDVYMDINKNWPLDNNNKKGFPEKDRLKFKTGLSIQRTNMDFVFENKSTFYEEGFVSSQQGTSFKSRELVQSYGNFALVTLEGKQYFTVLEQNSKISNENSNTGTEKSQNKYIGENAIFTAIEYSNRLDVLTGENSGEVEKLVSFKHDEENIQMLGLHIVEKNLIAVMLVNNILTFKAYNPGDGVLLAELTIPEYQPDRLATDIILYTPYVYENTLTLNITLHNPSTNIDNLAIKPDYLSIVSVKISDIDSQDNNSHSDSHRKRKFELLHLIDNYDTENHVISSVPTIAPVNGKLVVFTELREADNNTKLISYYNEFFYPVHFDIFVFDGIKNKSSLLYKGEVVTDADDDNEPYRFTCRNFNTNNDDNSNLINSGYDRLGNRNIGLVTVKGAK